MHFIESPEAMTPEQLEAAAKACIEAFPGMSHAVALMAIKGGEAMALEAAETAFEVLKREIPIDFGKPDQQDEGLATMMATDFYMNIMIDSLQANKKIVRMMLLAMLQKAGVKPDEGH